MKNVTVKIQPLSMGKRWGQSATMPDGAIEDFKDAAQRFPFLEVLEQRHFNTVPEMETLPLDVSAFALGSLPMNLGLLHQLARLGKPIFTTIIGRQGYPTMGNAELSGSVIRRAGGVSLHPFSDKDFESHLRTLRAIRLLHELRAAYFTTVEKYEPPYSVVFGMHGSEELMERFGIFLSIHPIEQYFSAVEEADADEAARVAHAWKSTYRVLDERESNLTTYARAYLAAKSVLEKHDANALCIHCDSRPRDRQACCGIDVTGDAINEFVPCWYYANLIDEGIPCFCKGDIPQLLTMSILMGISGESNLMGDLYRFGGNQQFVRENIITVTHDLIPPSMGVAGKPVKLRDMHGRGLGLSGVVELEAGRTATVAGVNRDLDEVWCCSGEVLWTKDIAEEQGIDSCRNSVGLRVRSALDVERYHVGEHQILTYGNWIEEIEAIGPLLGMRVRNLD